MEAGTETTTHFTSALSQDIRDLTSRKQREPYLNQPVGHWTKVAVKDSIIIVKHHTLLGNLRSCANKTAPVKTQGIEIISRKNMMMLKSVQKEQIKHSVTSLERQLLVHYEKRAKCRA